MFDPSRLTPKQAEAFAVFSQALCLLSGEAEGAFPPEGPPVNVDCIWKIPSRTAEVIHAVEKLSRSFGFTPPDWQAYADQLPHRREAPR